MLKMLRKSVGAENGNWKSFTQKVAENDVENVCVEMESGKQKMEKYCVKCCVKMKRGAPTTNSRFSQLRILW